MGLKEHLQAGAVLSRDIIELSSDVNYSGSVDLGSVYVLYTAESNTACRLRLYDNLSSLNDLTEKSRTFGDTNVPANIALIGDFTMSAGKYTIDPVFYGVTEDPVNKLTYYKVDNVASPPTFKFSRYLLEDSTVGSTNRTQLPSIQESLDAVQVKSGSVFDLNIPRTYLFVSATINNSEVPVRVRLYNTEAIVNDSTEKNRPYETETQTTALLIDAVLTGSEVTYFVPKSIGANLQNMGTELNAIKNSFSTLAGKHEMYYIIQNLSTSGPTQPVTASFHVFSLED